MKSTGIQAAVFALALTSLASCVLAADQPQWGQAWTRNMVSAERGLPDSFDPKTGLNIKWVAKLGTESHSTPIVAGGRVYVGTNNGEPRDPKHVGDRGVFMCFDERDGHLLWQLVVPKREEDPYHDWPKSGISSPATVEGDRVYLVSNRGEVMCLDALGMANGNDGPYLDEGRHMVPKPPPPGSPAALADKPTIRNPQSAINQSLLTSVPAAMEPGPHDADILWLFDLTSGAGIWSHDGAHSSILIHGDFLYLNTGTGVDNTHRKIRTPDAPSLVVLDKRTGCYLARDDEHIAPNIFHCTWSSPSLATVDGKELIFFAAGNGFLYAFEPLKKAPPSGEVAKLKKVWQFDFDPTGPKEEVHRFTKNLAEGPSNFYGMPVFHEGRLYLAGGGDWFWGKNEAWLKCLDPRGSGELTAKAICWSYPLGRHTMVTPPVHDGLVYATDSMRALHCVDAETGSPVWTHELNGEMWASPLVADGKVFIGTRRGEFAVLAAGREKKLLSTINLGAPISATAAAANGTLYVATMTHLYAISAQAKQSQP
ncbi:MAG: PQQ-binding-like beta-propeller repeat protein [Verrucomicrobia bacterium]|nr:PQQ-binding-like beta-propeller repeat protein [Verrucomicrobiota bacterium]